MSDKPILSRDQRFALKLLARGGARYGTRISAMKQLQDMGICRALMDRHGRWVWVPTDKGTKLISQHHMERN
jgi:hypothetical protein